MSETWEWPDSQIVRVIDGDSFYAELRRDIGFHGSVTFQQKLRLARINCKPKKTDEGSQARTALLALIGDSVLIHTEKPYKYGDEWMAEVWVDQINVSDHFVSRGLAVYWDGHGPRPD